MRLPLWLGCSRGGVCRGTNLSPQNGSFFIKNKMKFHPSKFWVAGGSASKFRGANHPIVGMCLNVLLLVKTRGPAHPLARLSHLSPWVAEEAPIVDFTSAQLERLPGAGTSHRSSQGRGEASLGKIMHLTLSTESCASNPVRVAASTVVWLWLGQTLWVVLQAFRAALWWVPTRPVVWRAADCLATIP